MPRSAQVTEIKKLSSGYWHVRFGPQRFVQWPIGAEPNVSYVFGEPKEELVRAAAAAVIQENY